MWYRKAGDKSSIVERQPDHLAILPKLGVTQQLNQVESNDEKYPQPQSIHLAITEGKINEWECAVPSRSALYRRRRLWYFIFFSLLWTGLFIPSLWSVVPRG